MKKLDIIMGALYYYNGGLVWLNEERDGMMWFEVGKYKVKVGYEKKGFLTLDCDCIHSSIKSKHFPMCSHKLACLFFLEHEHMKKIK